MCTTEAYENLLGIRDMLEEKIKRLERELDEQTKFARDMAAENEQLRAYKEAAERQKPVKLQHMAVSEDGELRWMTGRKIDNCELYAMPDFGRAPSLYARPIPSQQAVPDGWRDIIYRVRDQVANSPIDCLGTGYPTHPDDCAPWPIRDQVINDLTMLLDTTSHSQHSAQPHSQHSSEATASELLLALKEIADATNADDPESYRSDDREGCLDTVFAIASSAIAKHHTPIDRCPSHESAEQLEGKYQNTCLSCRGVFMDLKNDRKCPACYTTSNSRESEQLQNLKAAGLAEGE